MSEHPVTSIDDVVHQRVRLGILAITQEARRVEFSFLKEKLEISAGNLSQHLDVLEKALLINIEKGFEGRRPKTWVLMTKAGTLALQKELKSLKDLIKQIEK